MIIQLVATGIIFVAFGQLAIRVFKDKTTIVKLLFWLLFWGSALVLIWLPTDVIDRFGDIFGVGRGIDVLVYLSIIMIFYSILKINSRIDKLEKNITILVREIAKLNEKK